MTSLSKEESERIFSAVELALKYKECEVVILTRDYGAVIDIKSTPRVRIRERKERPTQERGRNDKREL